MRDYELMIKSPNPTGAEATEQLISRHFEHRDHISRVYDEVVMLGDTIISRIRQSYPQSVDLDTFHTNVKDKRTAWDRIWDQQNQLLQSHSDVTKLRKEAEEVPNIYRRC